jgi:hypothetical protein
MDSLTIEYNSGESVSIPFRDLDSAIRFIQAIYQRNSQQHVVDQPAIENLPSVPNQIQDDNPGIQRMSSSK